MARYFTPAGAPPDFDPQDELIASLTRINTFNPPVQTCSTGWNFSGLYSGPTSVAYLFYRLSQIYPDLLFKSQSLSDWAASYLELGSSYLTSGRHGRAPVDEEHCGVANETLSQLAVRAALLEDPSLAQQLCTYSSAINDAHGGSDEWLYGRAGYLYLLRLARSTFPAASHSTLHTQISKAISSTITRILATSQPWQWHGAPYIGAVHGSIGIMTQILLSSPTPSQHSTQLRPILYSLLNLKLPSGNFPSRSPNSDSGIKAAPSERLVQFCHGAPGIVISLASIRPFFPELSTRIEAAMRDAHPVLHQRGLLTKPPCLCHGIPTNALALLLTDPDDDGDGDDGNEDRNEDKFTHVLAHMSSASLESNEAWMADAGAQDAFVGLYTGEAGRAWTWAVADQLRNNNHVGGGSDDEKMKKVCEMGVIGYNDL